MSIKMYFIRFLSYYRHTVIGQFSWVIGQLKFTAVFVVKMFHDLFPSVL